MWVVLILAGWLALSLAMGPWIGRFVATHARVREDKPSPGSFPANPDPIAKPIGMVRRA